MRVCPTCNRPFGGKQRICFACRRPILKNHKWHTVGCYIEHDDCQNPTMRQLIRSQDAEPLLAGSPEHTEESNEATQNPGPLRSRP